MGSLNNGEPISQKHRVVRNDGHAVVVSDLPGDAEMAQKFKLSTTAQVKKLEDSILGMSGRLVWLDADYAPSVSLENGLVTAWADRTSNGVVADNSEKGADLAPATASLDIGDGTTRNVMHFDLNGKQLTLGNQLDSMVGAGKSFTIYIACRPTQILADDDFVSILSKFDDDFAAFYVYIYDNVGWDNPDWGIYGARFKTEVYTNTFNHGVTVMGQQHITANKTFVFRTQYDATKVGLNRVKLRTNAELDAVEASIWDFSFGSGISNINDNNEPLTIGMHSGTPFYRGFVGYFMELLIFNKIHTDEERDVVENYLGLKWGASQHFDSLRLGTA